MTPKRLNALQERMMEAERRHDNRAGVIASITYNVNRSKRVRAAKPRDFFVSLKKVQPKRVRQSTDEMLSIMTALAHAHNARLANSDNT